MFDLSALVALTLFNLIAVLQVASSSSRQLQDGLAQGTAVLCLAVSLTGLGLALLMPTLEIGIATVSIAALVNVLALLGPGARKLGTPPLADTASHLRGLARLYLVGSPYPPVAATSAGSAPVVARPVEPPVRRASKTSSRPIPTEAIRGIRTARPATLGSASGLLPRVTADVTSLRQQRAGPASAPARPRGDTTRLGQRAGPAEG